MKMSPLMNWFELLPQLFKNLDLLYKMPDLSDPVRETEQTRYCHLTFTQLVQVIGVAGSCIFSTITIIVNSIFGRFG